MSTILFHAAILWPFYHLDIRAKDAVGTRWRPEVSILRRWRWETSDRARIDTAGVGSIVAVVHEWETRRQSGRRMVIDDVMPGLPHLVNVAEGRAQAAGGANSVPVRE